MNNEPVAWMSNRKEFYVQKNYCPDFIPLYTHPAKTLTDEEIEEIYYKDFNHDGEDMLEFAKTWGELGPIYGKQWRKWGSNIIDELGSVYTNEVDYDIQNGKLPYGSSNRKFVIDEIKKLNPSIDQETR